MQSLLLEPSPHADNALALLGGGPYGPSDAVGFTNTTVVNYATRTDGVLLRPSWPLSSLDFTWTASIDPMGSDLQHVWAAHDDFSSALGPLRWSYALCVNCVRTVPITPARLQGPLHRLVAWTVQIGHNVSNVALVSDDDPLLMPAAVPAQRGLASHTSHSCRSSAASRCSATSPSGPPCRRGACARCVPPPPTAAGWRRMWWELPARW